jgi:addiction module HigA family antidote
MVTPKNRQPTHPGEVLFEEFLVPLQMTQVELANTLSVPIQRINTIINRKRGITAETAILLARALGTTPEFWMHLQVTWDLYEAKQRLDKAA